MDNPRRPEDDNRLSCASNLAGGGTVALVRELHDALESAHEGSYMSFDGCVRGPTCETCRVLDVAAAWLERARLVPHPR